MSEGLVPADSGRQLLDLGPAGLCRLPTVAGLAGQDGAQRHRFLDEWRAELYAVAGVLAELAVSRAWIERAKYPPYGLVRSFFSQLRVVAVDPRPFEEGSIEGFVDLGQALLDSVVFHLERELSSLRQGDDAWLVDRLDHLLALYRIDAGPAGQARIRDPFSFIYGGLHFGTSVCVQLAEVMTRMLDDYGERPAGEKVAVLARSSRILHQLAAVNIDDVPAIYQRLLGESSPWLSTERLVVRCQDARPWKIELTNADALVVSAMHTTTTFQTRGCPASRSMSGRPAPIAVLWRWCCDLLVSTRLLVDP